MTTEVKKNETRDQAVPAKPERIYVPNVDIFENDDETVLLVDMPGVDDKSADVSFENQVLRIAGKVTTEIPAGHRLVREENDATGFERTFAVSHDIDAAGIKATMKNGVLRVVLPRAPEAKPRKIEIAGE